MPQTPAIYRKAGNKIKYTPVSDVIAGQVIVLGTVVAIAEVPIPANTQGDLTTVGEFDVPKTSDEFSQGDDVFWNASGNPVLGTAGTGAADSATGVQMGKCTLDAGAEDNYVRVKLTSTIINIATLGGSVTADDITGSDSSLAISGLSATQGGAIVIAGGPSTGGNNNGGGLTLRGGAKNGAGADGVLTIGATVTSAINVGAAGVATRNAGNHQVNGTSAVTATTGGGTTGLIPAGASLAIVTSDSADKQISLPAATVGDEIEIYIAATGCELISAVAGHKANDVVIGATNELALEPGLYRCKYVATNIWIVTGVDVEGVAVSPLTPDAL